MVASCGLVKDTLFSNKVSEEKVEDYASLVQDEAFRGYLDMIFNLPKLKNSPQIPFLVLGAANDRIISPREVMATGEVYHAPVHIFEEGGHDMMLDQGWQAVADRMLEWLVEQDFN
jgi:pimeloyl-ACP methyl ester carboxylesterase